MSTDWVRGVCLKLPHTTEEILWGSLVFKVGGKMYAVAALEPGKVWLSFKCSPEKFVELTEREGIVPAPYLARNHWVALETEEALATSELRQSIADSYELVVGKLSKKVQAAIRNGGAEISPRRRTEKHKVKSGDR